MYVEGRNRFKPHVQEFGAGIAGNNTAAIVILVTAGYDYHAANWMCFGVVGAGGAALGCRLVGFFGRRPRG